MMYDILVTIHNSPNKTVGWGYLIKAESKKEAIDKALGFAQEKAMKAYSRFKNCTFTIEDKDVKERPDW